MLNVSRDILMDVSEVTGGHGGATTVAPMKPASALGNLRRHARSSAAIVALFTALGLGYALTATPLYTASTEILIDARRSHANEAGASNRSLAELGMDPASIDSQVAVLGSERIAIDALKQLHLDHDTEFATPTTLPGALLLGLKHALGRGASPDTNAGGVPADILEGFMKNLDVKRVQQTYVLSVSFTARSPERAATVVNTIANIYQDGQVRAALDARARADAWLKERTGAVRTEIAAAEQAVRSLKAEMGQNGATAGTPLVPPDPDRLRDLERDLDGKRMLYGALVERGNTALQLQSMPVSDASVLKAARAPKRPSQPNTPLLLVLGALAGVAAALGVATWREMADRSFRLPSQVEDRLGVRVLAALPRIRVPRRARADILLADWHERGDGPAKGVGQRFSGPLRAVRLAADGGFLHDRLVVVGVTSALDGEGRTTVALNLAGAMARSGRRTLVVDADLTRPRLSADCGARRAAGLPEVARGLATLAEAVVRHGDAGVDILPACGSASPGEVTLGLADLERILAAARPSYDAVVLDLPPLAAQTEVSAYASAIGAFVLVVAWAETERAVVAEALAAAPAVANRLVGAVLNRADPRALSRLARDPKDVVHLAGAARASNRAACAGDG